MYIFKVSLTLSAYDSNPTTVDVDDLGLRALDPTTCG